MLPNWNLNFEPCCLASSRLGGQKKAVKIHAWVLEAIFPCNTSQDNCQIKTLEIKCLFVLDWPDFFCEINFVWSCWAIKLNCLIKFNWFWLLIVWFGTSEFTTGLHYRRSRKWSHKSTYDSVKVKHRSPKHSRKHDGIGVGRIGTFPFSSDSTYDSIAYDLVRLLESEAEGED